MAQIHRLSTQCHSHLQTGWNGCGTAFVAVETPSADVLIFREEGQWQSASGGQFAFNNIYRWTRQTDCIGLAHLRFGPDRPVFLFDLAPAGSSVLRARAPHPCGDDRYDATLRLETESLHLTLDRNGTSQRRNVDLHPLLATNTPSHRR